jgi:acyl-homoserine-lactone acylase
MKTARALVGQFALAVALHGCGAHRTEAPTTAPATTPAPAPIAAPSYRATVRWTSHAIPHIVADDLGSLAFGQGYAFATLHVCVLADQIVKLRGERARRFGPGENNANVESDFGWLAIGVHDEAHRALPRLSADAAAMLRGFVAGYNRYLADTRRDALPPDCANADWVQPIDEIDLLSHWGQVAILGTTAYFVDSIAAAQPPGTKTSAREVPAPDLQRADAPASNGWGIGAERSETGRGLLVANPHFPWEGERRFYEMQLTIPGSLDAYGANLLGLPLISIGFNDHLAWTHTFSSSRRFILYRLTLDPADPTRYRYDGETRAMTSRELAIQVRQADGSLTEVRRRVYRSHHGPMLSNAQLPWDTEHAFALREVAGGNPGTFDQYLAMMRATDLAGFEAAFARYQSTGFVNTIYADRDGNALYIDGSAVPDLPANALAALATARGAMPALAEAWKRGVVIADGSQSMFELAADPAAPRPGAVPYAHAPRLARRDFVANANDPYWLTNPAAPLTGFSPLYGEPGAPSARTRMNLRLLTQAGDASPAGADGKFSVAELQAAILDDRAITAELLRADVAARCAAAVKKRKEPALERACATLAAWDGRYDVGSRGAVLWREWLAAYPGSPYAVPFDAAHPLDTPRGLAPAPNTGADPVIVALRAAIAQLERAGIDPSGALGDAQWFEKAGRRFAVPGSRAAEGSTNPTQFSTANSTLLPRMVAPEVINAATGLYKGGYPSNYGTSFLMVVGFTDTGLVAHALLTYSASSDPRSPAFTDQTEMYGRKAWRTIRFTAADIAADPELHVQTVCSAGCAPAR